MSDALHIVRRGILIGLGRPTYRKDSSLEIRNRGVPGAEKRIYSSAYVFSQVLLHLGKMSETEIRDMNLMVFLDRVVIEGRVYRLEKYQSSAFSETTLLIDYATFRECPHGTELEAELERDRMIFGNSFELDGKRIDPRHVLLNADGTYEILES